jgi:hypothetical protein
MHHSSPVVFHFVEHRDRRLLGENRPDWDGCRNTLRHAAFGLRRSVGFSAAFLRKCSRHKQLQFSLE